MGTKYQSLLNVLPPYLCMMNGLMHAVSPIFKVSLFIHVKCDLMLLGLSHYVGIFKY